MTTHLPPVEQLAERCRAVLEAAWCPSPGYAAPHTGVYPWCFLWDSCFHAVVWAELGDERALVELASVLAGQDALGFVPHMGYHPDPTHHASFWGVEGWSTITQPPMYGHVVAELVDRGLEVPEPLLERCRHGIGFLLRHRRRHAGGLVELVHPWESGADDSPRWDHFLHGPGGWDLVRWRARKGELLASVVRAPEGSPVANPDFPVASAGFNALVSFNAAELGRVLGDHELLAGAEELARALDERWDPERATWVDAGPSEASSGRAATVDGLLGALTTTDPAKVDAALGAALDPAAFGAPFGPTGVSRQEPSFVPDQYWRGPTWPQLTYLLWVAARRHGRDEEAAQLADATVRGAWASGFAEYWDPDTGEGLGAAPQSWTTLALVMARR